ncbi:lon-related putative ATP-dependent protease [Thermosyntropha lipolytica DSM 11003]|uniref:endopeptidase La n=1 Tax=Thermosyntropha lipolytica DSM 11003 TaxID=1123382 RepID=A0A1M5KT46_9FIRM|nr:ATP-binding protein [Thermosyntropha lipolytica]SHG55974.1 lon-related putative ATP-dependent protease [Thermosyntropha lipolytica DSM 11003]
METNRYKVKVKDLRKKCNPGIFKFKSTAELKPLSGIIAQERALKAVSLGIDIDHPGYNVYLSGAVGCGKMTLARQVLENKAKKEPVPSDWCYVYNFKNPDAPKALELPPGQGKVLQKAVAENIESIIDSLIKALNSEEFENKKNQILNNFMEETNRRYLKLEEEARAYGFTIARNESGITTIPLKDGQIMSQEDFMRLSDEERDEIMKKGAVVQEKLNEALRQYRELEKNVREQVKALEDETAREVIKPYFNKLIEKYRDFPEVTTYLEEMQEDLLENKDSFIKHDDSPLGFLTHVSKRSLFRRYQVNLIVDNSELKHAPVIFETNPTYANLFGQIEYEGEFGILSTDFSKIKAGAVHRANGGYLVLNVDDILNNFYVWDKLKKVIKNQEITIESIGRMIGITNTETLQPEPIPCHIKVVLIGEPIYYYLLYNYDNDFQKLFKIRADFDTEMERSRKHMYDYARFVCSVCTSKGLKHFTPQAVAQLVEYGSRLVEHQDKLTTLFNKLEEIIYEADCLARYENEELVTGEHVKKAIEEKKNRSSLLEDKIQEYIKEGTLLIDTKSWKIGEINGLAVYDLGDYSFGKPVRITAKTFMGEKGLVNIEREIHLSGRIHSKGVLILSGFLGAKYAQDKPLSLSASLTFEQSYSGIEGDSASSAELYALLSSLAEVPIYQGIAVTGSVNQNGEIQPVGGVNQKIEGFFKVCKEQGLNGKQGVIIPKQNIPQLMLDEEVIEAVKAKKFNIWAVEHIDEGLEILTGMEAGKPDKNGKYPPGTIHYLVDNKLRSWSRRQNRIAKTEGKGKTRGYRRNAW